METSNLTKCNQESGTIIRQGVYPLALFTGIENLNLQNRSDKV